jgi:hypothetical protein
MCVRLPTTQDAQPQEDCETDQGRDVSPENFSGQPIRVYRVHPLHEKHGDGKTQRHGHDAERRAVTSDLTMKCRAVGDDEKGLEENDGKPRGVDNAMEEQVDSNVRNIEERPQVERRSEPNENDEQEDARHPHVERAALPHTNCGSVGSADIPSR